MKAWFTAAEIAAAGLPGLPSSKRKVNARADREGWAHAINARGEPLARPRQGRGGGLEFHVTLLPEAARAALQGPASALSAPPTREESWAAFERLPAKKKAVALRRAEILQKVELLASTSGRTASVAAIAIEADVAKASIYTWFKLVDGIDKADRLPLLAPRHQGGQARTEIDEDAFAIFKSDWLRLSQPSFESCYRRTAAAVEAKGIELAPLAVMKRRLLRETPASVVILLREGGDALKAAYPHQTRDRSAFSACEAMVADTHMWDVMVAWPDGTFGRPAMIAISDLYSNKMLAWRFGRSENSEAVRLTFGDAFRAYGVPDHIWLDNGRSFAGKQVSGGQPNRYRFKVLPEDPEGMLTALGVQVHWTTPYAGQSKPIERSFRDFAHDFAKHPAFEGAYTGHNTVEKPANYGSRAIPLDDFIDVAQREIALWNARSGRNTQICRGKLSFDEAFEASYATATPKRPTPEQLRLCMLSSRPLTCAQDDGAISIDGNRYHNESLLAVRGQKVFVRFDPQDLHGEVYVYDLAKRFLTAATCILKAGFADVEAGRTHARARADFIKATRVLAKAERRHDAAELARLQAELEPPPPRPLPDAAAVRPIFGNLAVQARPLQRDDEDAQPKRRNLLDRFADDFAEREGRHLRIVASE